MSILREYVGGLVLSSFFAAYCQLLAAPWLLVRLNFSGGGWRRRAYCQLATIFLLSSVLSSLAMIKKIISGGQTGADRAALDVAIELGIPHGGWVPKGRMAEDGRLPGNYRLSETSTIDYNQRTELNVIDSEGTLYSLMAL